MDKEQLDLLVKPLIEIYDEIELEIIANILNKLSNYTSVAGSMEWYLEKLNDLGVLDKDTLAILKEHKNEIEQIIKKLPTNTINNIDDFDRLVNYHKQGLLETNPLNIFNSVAMNNLMNNAAKDVKDIMKLIDSKVLEGTDEAYKKILNKAYVETASGVYSYQESIRNALKEFAKEGIRTVHYDNGRTLSIEAVVRRDVTTRVNKLVGDVTLENCKKLGTNLVYVDQHEGARVRTPYMKNDYEAHAEWQGKVYMIKDSNEKHDNFFEKTGYGEMLGLKGINCYHNFWPHFEWESIPERIDEEENTKKRKLLDKQRAYERKIRQLKREKEIYKQIDKEEYKRTSNKLKNVNSEYNKFLDDNNLRRDYSREYVTNINNEKTFDENLIPDFMKKPEERLKGKEAYDYVVDSINNKKTKEIIKKAKIKYGSHVNCYIPFLNQIHLKNDANIYSHYHELAHFLERKKKLYQEKKFMDVFKKKFEKYTINDYELVDSKSTGKYYRLKDCSKFVSKYQTRLYYEKNSFIKNKPNYKYIKEYFSEGMKYYYKDRELLKKIDKELYNYLKEILDE
ncbi:MAG TPA: hypothetical protein DCE23_04385 [Firmicutes bacterium]|nr:hypothetical protein [Bacillota bacterium]